MLVVEWASVFVRSTGAESSVHMLSGRLAVRPYSDDVVVQQTQRLKSHFDEQLMGPTACAEDKSVAVYVDR